MNGPSHQPLRTETNIAEPAASELLDVEPAQEEEELPTDDAPQDGDVLLAGDYLIEMATATPVRREVLSTGLTRVGFSKVWHDQSRARGDDAFAVREHRFVARLTRPIHIHQHERIRWIFARQIGTDVLRELKDLRNTLVAYDLVPGALYEAFFQSSPPPPSLRGIPLRQVVEQTLGEMGFIPHKLTALRRDVPSPHARGRMTDQTISLWFGLLEWDGPAGIVTDEDPFYFEELVAL